ncbi:MAG: DUF1549 domain-containing protein [Planctomycetota bacterium]
MSPAFPHLRRVALAALLALATSAAFGKAPAPPACDDATFLRRASLDLVGRQPSPAEIEAFLADPSPSKRQDLVDRLLADPAWAANWARYFRDVILYRRSDDRALGMAPAVEAFFAKHLEQDAAWDDIARDVITATGVPSENGATAIVIAQMGETADIAAEISRVFTGVQIQCAQCHDHFTDRWKRTQFHEFAAFFPRVEIRRGPGEGLDRFEVASFDRGRGTRGKNPNNPRRGDLEHQMPHIDDPSKPGTVMTPKFFVGGKGVPLGTPDLERRVAAARLITADDNPWFARAIVNRIWTELVGDGFYDGIDDLGPDREPRFPELLDELCRAFVAADHDLRTLFRAVMATPAYQSTARSRGDAARPVGDASCPQRLRADQLFSQVLAALGVDESQVAARADGRNPGRRPGGRQVNLPRLVFNQTFGYDPGLPRDEIVGSIPQALLLMNSQPLARALDGDQRFTLLGRLLAEMPDDRELADELHLRTLARHATPEELAVCVEHVRETGDRADAFEDIFWALVNSAEFIHRK